MKTVTILLTKYMDIGSRIISMISPYGYTHASISIDENEEIFYSFNYRGFVIETPKKRYPSNRCPENAYIRLSIPEDTYEIIKQEIEGFLACKEYYTYSRIGVVLCLLQIPHKFSNKYFCSQFVAEILSHAGAIHVKKNESLYLPDQLIDGIECLFSHKQVEYQLF